MKQLATYLSLAKQASRQEQRYPFALRSTYAKVEHRDLSQWLAYTSDMANCFVYINNELEASGTWSELFSRNELSLISQLSHYCEFHTKHQLLFTPNTQSELKIQHVLKCSFKLNNWLHQLNLIDSSIAANLRSIVSSAINTRLQFELHKLLASADIPANNMQDLSELNSLWEIDANMLDDIAQNQKLEALEFTKSPINHGVVDKVYYTFIGELATINNACMQYLHDLLHNHQHQSAVAMVITFLHLYQKVQDKINTFAAKHLEYYYFDVLNIKAPPLAPQTALLQLQAKHECLITTENEFTATSSAGNTLSFVPNGLFSINPGKITHLLHINQQKDPLIAPEYLFAHPNKIVVAQRFNSLNKQAYAQWPLFGIKQQFDDRQTQEQAHIGFAIAAKDFVLKEGERQIDITFSLFHKSESANLINHLNAIKKLRETPLTQTIEPYKACLVKCFNEFNSEFLLSFSSANIDFVDSLEQSAIEAFFELPSEQQISQCLFFYLLHRLAGKELAQTNAKALGLILSQQVLSGGTWLSSIEIKQLQQTLRTNLKTNKMLLSEVNTVIDIIQGNKQFRHALLIQQLFSLRITTELGWLEQVPHKVSVLAPKAGKARLHVSVRIGAASEAVVGYDASLHKAKYSTNLPVFEFALNPQANYFGYGLLSDFKVIDANIQVQASGIHSIVARNQLGPLDLSNTFMPFGSRPNQYSYFQLGCYEAAQKNVIQYQVQVQYAQLPKQSNGFERHYQGYPVEFTKDVFEVDKALYVNGNFTSIGSSKMFASKQQKLLAKNCYTFVSNDGFSALKPHITQQQFTQIKEIKNGYLRIAIKQPEYAFGHAIYPTLLANTLIENNRLKRVKQQNLPNAPYTPEIEKLSMSYTANSYHDFANTNTLTNSNRTAQLFHFSVLGTHESTTQGKQSQANLLPSLSHNANLVMGISTPQAPKHVSLFFELNDDCAIDINLAAPKLSFKVYTQLGWQTLPGAYIIYDGTYGLTSAGVITLKMPANIENNPTAIAPNQYWIMLCANEQADLFSSVISVKMNVIRVTAKISTSDLKSKEQKQSTANTPPETLNNWLSHLAHIQQVQPVTKLVNQSQEKTKAQLITATSERLRHKNRPVTPLDFEQYILEQFPSIYMVKCFAHMDKNAVNLEQNKISLSPGSMLIIVLPYAKEGQLLSDATSASSKALIDIQTAVRAVAPQFAKIQVSNPLYERIQIRCSVKFAQATNTGVMVQQLNHHISDYFNPFNSNNNRQSFGWKLSCEEMLAHIQNHALVEYVTNFSILHISQASPMNYQLQDSVTMAQAEWLNHSISQAQGSKNIVIQSHYPWCLPLPNKHHVIDLIDHDRFEAANITGVNEMEIGNNFILGA